MEKWKAIPKTDGYYEVSNRGRVRSWHNNTNTPGRRDEPIIMSQTIHPKTGYHYIVLRINGKKKTLTIHRLVAKAFVDNPEDKPCVNHLDGDKDNNYASNFEWCTYSENSKHAYDNGLLKNNFEQGEKHPSSKLTKTDVLDIRNAYRLGCFTQKEIGEAYGVARSLITNIVNRKYWKHV